MALALEIAFAAAARQSSRVSLVGGRVRARSRAPPARARGRRSASSRWPAAVVAGIEIARGQRRLRAPARHRGRPRRRGPLPRPGSIWSCARAPADARIRAARRRRAGAARRPTSSSRPRSARTELDRMLARERAEASYALGEQERQLAEERRDAVARQAEHARVELTEAVAGAQGRLETRLMAWAADLDRGQRELEAQLEPAQPASEGGAGRSTTRACTPTPSGLPPPARSSGRRWCSSARSSSASITQFVEEGRAEVETHAAERRRALHEVSERLRNRERGLQRADRPRGGRVALHASPPA